jgi:ribosomal protein S2
MKNILSWYERQASNFELLKKQSVAIHYINHRWLPDWTTLTERTNVLKNLEQQEADNTFNANQKKKQLYEKNT